VTFATKKVDSALLGLGAVLLTAMWAHALLGLGGSGADEFVSTWVYDAIVFAAALALLWRAFSRPHARLPWVALGVGLLLHGFGDVIYSTAPDLDAVPVPSISDPLWLAIYPCAYIALLALTLQRVGPTLLATRLDGMVSGLAVAALLASVSLPLALDATAGAPFWETATGLAYTVGDLVLLGAVVSAIALGGWRMDRTWLLLATAVIAWEAADLMYLFDVEVTLGHVADALVATGTLAIAIAGSLYAHGSERRSARGHGLLLPVVFGVLALGVLALGVPLSLNVVALGLAAASLALALVRMALALSENQSLLGESRVEALTDPLTGLLNRRSLKTDLAALLDDSSARGSHALSLLDLNGFKGYNDTYGHSAGDALLVRLGAALAEEVHGHGTAYRMGGDEFCVLAPCLPEQAEAFSARCASALATRGQGFSITAAHGVVTIPDEQADAVAALTLADARMYQRKKAGRIPAASQSAGVLIAVLEERAPVLAEHVRSVCELAQATAVELGVDGGDLEALRHAAALHDIGKMAIPESVLEKPGPLSEDEWTLIRQHTVIGERILATAPALERSAPLVRWSHERIDGCGYPDGLAGDEIPLAARIISVADAFDAMCSDRGYGRTRSPDEALAELRRCAGTQFDGAVVAAFERMLSRLESITHAESAHAFAGGAVAALASSASK
jgi:diguanylate cyclase (GGDEF)-like protein/putative nucleotidyltransferase with HDIG domain